MPHLALEFSENVIEKNNMINLLQQCHAILVDTLPTSLESCKSRAVERNVYCVANGQPDNAFVHVELKVMPGRDSGILKLLGDRVMDALSGYFSQSLSELKLQITLEIIELEQHYFKKTN